MEKLKVKAFGPLNSVNLKLKPCVVLIGPQSSGKSAVAKLVSILRDPKFIMQAESFEDLLKSYDIDSYLSSNSEISYSSPKYKFEYSKGEGTIVYINESFQNLVHEFETAQKQAPSDAEMDKKIKESGILAAKLKLALEESNGIESEELREDLNLMIAFNEDLKKYNEQLLNITLRAKKVFTYSKFSIYIPSDRNLFSTILNSKFSLNENQIPLPNTIQRFGSHVENAQLKVPQFSIDFLKLTYSVTESGSKIDDLRKNTSFPLNNASSGLQSLIPLLQVIEANSQNPYGDNTFVVEEPELNLFPKAQYDLLKLIVSKCYNIEQTAEGKTSDLIITTHSPYCLSALNNMLLAFKVVKNVKSSTKVDKIIHKKARINPNDFAAYYMSEGKAKSIVDRNTGLIDENELDSTSYEINDDFEKLFNSFEFAK